MGETNSIQFEFESKVIFATLCSDNKRESDRNMTGKFKPGPSRTKATSKLDRKLILYPH